MADAGKAGKRSMKIGLIGFGTVGTATRLR